MLAYVSGTLMEKTMDGVVVDNHGMGYSIQLPASQISQLPPVGEELRVHVFLHVKEDGIFLYGFLDRDSLELFRLLITVSGVGPKGALGILSTLSPSGLRAAILTQDAKAISKAPGVGAKTAQRIIIDLKDKMSSEELLNLAVETTEPVNDQVSEKRREAIEALVALGYSAKDAKDAVAQVEGDEDVLTVEDYLKQTLRFMV